MLDPVSDILIFGAGFGTRMAPLTATQPKPLIPVAGKPLIDHAIALADDLNLAITVNAHYRAEQMVDHFTDRPDVRVIVEQPDILDTGGGLKNTFSARDGHATLTLNSDALWKGPNPLDLLRAQWQPNKMDALLLLVPISQTVGYSRAGNFRPDEAGHIIRSDNGHVYAGAQIIKTAAVSAIPDTVFSLNAVWDNLLAQGTAYGVTYPGQWADVGTPQGIPIAEDMLRDV